MYASTFIIGLFLITSTVAGIAQDLSDDGDVSAGESGLFDDYRPWLSLAAVGDVPVHLSDMIFGKDREGGLISEKLPDAVPVVWYIVVVGGFGVAAMGQVSEDSHVSAMSNSANGAAIVVSEASKWFGSVVAVNDVSFEVGPGITGLLGPNGAGKTTVLHMIAGLAKCSRGSVSVLGEPARENPGLYKRMGFMPEHESVYGFFTGRQLVEFAARLNGVSQIDAAVDRAIAMVGLEDAQNRRMGGYSRGMRQRMRLAATLVHDPQVIILDEPLNGTDPRQRIEFHDVMERLASEGRTILISSHILEEVETLASRILLMISGKLAASGDFRAIRAKLDEQAYRVRVVVDSPRKMASAVMGMEEVDSVSVGEDGSLLVYSRRVAALQVALPRLAKENGVRLTRVEPTDDSLESLFEYVVER